MVMDTFLEEAARGLAELFSGPIKGPGPHHRYELVRGESGELEFQLDELHILFDSVMKEICGAPEEPTVLRFKLDPKTALLRYR
jgi:hypothetical protein